MIIELAIAAFGLAAADEPVHVSSFGGPMILKPRTDTSEREEKVDGLRCTSEGRAEVKVFPIPSKPVASARRPAPPQDEDSSLGCILGIFTNDKLVCAHEGGYGLSSLASGTRYMDLTKGAQLSLFSGPVMLYENTGAKHSYEGGTLSVQQDNSPKNWNSRWSFKYDTRSKTGKLTIESQGTSTYTCMEPISHPRQGTK